jgi:lysozyme
MKKEIYDTLIELIKHYESLHDGDLKVIGLQPKMCPAGYWTEGYGSLVLDAKGKPLHGIANKSLALQLSKINTESEALTDLKKNIDFRIRLVENLNLVINDFQKAAIVSFVYNLGFRAFTESTLLKRIKNFENDISIDIEFRKWNKGVVNGVREVLPGLDYRRTTESLLFTKGILKFYN